MATYKVKGFSIYLKYRSAKHLYSFTPIQNNKVAQSVSCKRSQVLQMCVIRAISYSLLCWLP